MTIKCSNLTFDARLMFLSVHNGFNCVRAEVACAFLERTPCMEPSSDTTDPRHCKLDTGLSVCLILMSEMLLLLVICFVFSALISIPYVQKVESSLSIRLASSIYSPVSPSMLSTKWRLVIILPPMLTVPLWSIVWMPCGGQACLAARICCIWQTQGALKLLSLLSMLQ